MPYAKQLQGLVVTKPAATFLTENCDLPYERAEDLLEGPMNGLSGMYEHAVSAASLLQSPCFHVICPEREIIELWQ